MICKNKKCSAELPDGAVFCLYCGRKQTSEPKKRRKRSNGSGTVYKLSGRRRRPWVAAKDRVIIGYFETMGAAEEALNALAKKPITERYNMTFKEVYEAWKNEHYRKLTKKGIEGYEVAYKHFAELHDIKFRELRTEHYQKELDKFVQKGRSYSAANKLKQLIGQLCKWAIREEIITVNYAQFMLLPENKKKEKDIFSAEDIKKLKASNSETAKIILMLIYTGMRIGELFSLKTSNVFETYCIGGEKTEAGRNRIIPIPSEVREHFSYFTKKAGDSELLIDGYDGNKEVDNFRSRDYYSLLDELGIQRKSPHCTRHTFASMAVVAGMQPEILQKVLGHANYSTTSDIYVHTNVEAMVNAVETLAKMMSKSPKASDN